MAGNHHLNTDLGGMALQRRYGLLNFCYIICCDMFECALEHMSTCKHSVTRIIFLHVQQNILYIRYRCQGEHKDICVHMHIYTSIYTHCTHAQGYIYI